MTDIRNVTFKSENDVKELAWLDWPDTAISYMSRGSQPVNRLGIPALWGPKSPLGEVDTDQCQRVGEYCEAQGIRELTTDVERIAGSPETDRWSVYLTDDHAHAATEGTEEIFENIRKGGYTGRLGIYGNQPRYGETCRGIAQGREQSWIDHHREVQNRIAERTVAMHRLADFLCPSMYAGWLWPWVMASENLPKHIPAEEAKLRMSLLFEITAAAMVVYHGDKPVQWYTDAPALAPPWAFDWTLTELAQYEFPIQIWAGPHQPLQPFQIGVIQSHLGA